ncbi:hypothetical protein N657DRAFT_610956 [Parathielavia appendiculata]|uniref:Uncharacterized protein n=1 Tax=Parathielavia appendiculata TaxID=2587402 RepID=A0AAN6U5Q2_9PEZI|nr:hypothetical protein N657DRAFT_610956 [Parathielavia appendiculata]
MVTTRRGARSSAVQDESSPGEASIASIPNAIIRHRAPVGTPAALRPSREPTVGLVNTVKRERDPSATSDLPRHKRRRPVTDVLDSIEVQGEDDDVDAAITATNTCRTANFEIVLPSVRMPRSNDQIISTKAPLEHSAKITTARPLRTRRLRRHIQSRESPPRSPQPRDHAAEQRREGAPAKPLGSPELQLSALKRRGSKPLTDVYDITDDEDSEPASPPLVRRPRTINGLELRSQLNVPRRRAPQQRNELSHVREMERAPPGNPVSSEAPLFLGDDQDRELLQDTDGAEEAQQETHESDEYNESEEGQDIDDEAHADGGRSQVPRTPDFVGVRVRPYLPSEPTIAVFSDHLNKMSEIMGRRGWTGAGRRWRRGFNVLDSGDQPPARTGLGKSLFRSLAALTDKLEEVPNAMDLTGQSQFLAEHHQYLQTAMSKVDRAVNKIESLAVRPDAMMEDLSSCSIPMLVFVLRRAFAMGAKEPDAVVNDFAAAEGIFTWTTIQYVMFIFGWVSRLLNVLIPEMRQQGKNDANSRSFQPYDPEDEKKNRELVGVMVRKWKQQLRAGVDSFNEQVDAIRERREKKQRDARIKAAREQEQAAELARHRQREMAFASSIQEITSRPRPMAEKFRRVLQQPAFSPANSQVLTVTERLTPGTGARFRHSHSSTASRLLHPPAPTQKAAPLPAPADNPPWPDAEVEWFLGELRRPNGGSRYNLEVCAETLDRTMREVRMEMERLRRLGLYRSPSRGH